MIKHCVSVVCIGENCRVLVVHEKHKGDIKLNVPTGHIEEGESPYEAAKRETLEETGYHLKDLWLVGITDLKVNETIYHTYVYAGVVDTETILEPINDDDVVLASWFHVGELQVMENQYKNSLVYEKVKMVGYFFQAKEDPFNTFHKQYIGIDGKVRPL